MLCEVDADFLRDDTNYNGLRPWESGEYNWDAKPPAKNLNGHIKNLFLSAETS